MFTLETRLQKREIGYFLDYISFYNRIFREVWQHYTHGGDVGSKYRTALCKKYNLTSRTVNSISEDVVGRCSALVALQERQCLDLESRIEVIDESISALKFKISSTIVSVRDNKASPETLRRYKNWKARLYSLQCKKDRYSNKLKSLHGRPKMSFGSAELWGSQFHLKENGYKSYDAWLNEYRRRRDRYIYYIGSSDSCCGNTMFQMKHDKALDLFHVKVRMENQYVENDKYMYFDVNFKSKNRSILIQMLSFNQAMSYRVLQRGRKWYLQVMFKAAFNVCTSERNGCLGVFQQRFSCIVGD